MSKYGGLLYTKANRVGGNFAMDALVGSFYIKRKGAILYPFFIKHLLKITEGTHLVLTLFEWCNGLC